MPYKNKDDCNARARARYAENPEKVRKYQRKWRADHPEEEKARHAIDNLKFREYLQKWHKDRDERERREAIAILGGVCCKCRFSDVRALQIDHINGGGRKEITALGRHKFYRKVVETNGEGYQLLCANCNWIKRCQLPQPEGCGLRLRKKSCRVRVADSSC